MEKSHQNLGNQKGDNSSIKDDILMKLHVHNHDMAIYFQCKLYVISFHWLPSYG